ncbi:potassium channel family protein [Candidatus Leptofilum sp.]|uniref:potassium channel family protein n=1 Tax=Candidatus Leptofilum sp. TaxID=3241576 RepID=UPI003B59D0A3
MNKQNSPVEGKVIYVLILVTLVQTIYPISISNTLVALIGYQVLYMSLMVAGILVVRERPYYTWALVFTGLVWLAAGIIYALNPLAQWANIISYIIIAIFQGLVVRVLLHYIFTTRRVSRDVLYAACAVYLLLGAIFVPIYGLIETFTWFPKQTNHAFVDGLNSYEGAPIPWQTFIYYSYATLTTLGYGDILPTTFWARSVASIEAIVGVLYITIIMARLVELYAAHEGETERVSA